LGSLLTKFRNYLLPGRGKKIGEQLDARTLPGRQTAGILRIKGKKNSGNRYGREKEYFL